MAAVVARSLLAAGRASGRRCRALPVAGAAPHCTVAPQQQQQQQPAPDMKSYLWSRYKEAKRVTKGERRAGAVAAARLPHRAITAPAAGRSAAGLKANKRMLAARRGGTTNPVGAVAAACRVWGDEAQVGVAERTPALIPRGDFPSWVAVASGRGAVRSRSHRGSGVKSALPVSGRERG